jgi:hypothetical protein
VAAFLLVPAAQAFAENVTVTVGGTGSGEVSSAEGLHAFMPESFPAVYKGEPPIECSYASPGPASGTCANELEDLEEGVSATALHAIASPGSEFAGWTITGSRPFGNPFEGCQKVEGEEGLNPEMWLNCFAYVETGSAENITATATFNLEPPKFALTIAKTGEGTITSSPKGIVCTGAKTGAECEGKFNTSSTVTLTASPATGYAFSAWAGCTEHVGLTCKVLMDKAKTVKVTFVATPSLSIEKAGSGQGKVGAPGISCDENCSKATSAVKTGTSVTVKVTPAKGSEAAIFEGGTGSASGCSGASCTFTISANSSVKVKFDSIPTKAMTVKLTGPAAYKGKVSGKGIVKGLTGAAINCGAGCTSQVETFFSTDEVTLSAAAGTGYTFAGWSVSGGSAGTCTGTTTPCTLKTDADKTVSAEFK